MYVLRGEQILGKHSKMSMSKMLKMIINHLMGKMGFKEIDINESSGIGVVTGQSTPVNIQIEHNMMKKT